MRKVILFNMVTLDGFFEGPDGDLDWHNVDEEFTRFAIEQVSTADGLIFGRRTYEMMASFWPTDFAIQTEPIVANHMNTLPKIVFSRTLDKADWSHSRLVNGDAAEEVSRLKQQPGKDLFVFGSADLAASLAQHGLIDEYRIMVNPVVLGSGAPLFQDIHAPLKLKLIKTRTFGNGNVLLTYQPDGNSSQGQVL